MSGGRSVVDGTRDDLEKELLEEDLAAEVERTKREAFRRDA